jgi:hypothetical protein
VEGKLREHRTRTRQHKLVPLLSRLCVVLYCRVVVSYCVKLVCVGVLEWSKTYLVRSLQRRAAGLVVPQSLYMEHHHGINR